ncbi:CTP synthetase [Actibacterium sp. XHP0104]|uniref:CTP synthetase n=1 Tax=Actibacterium sp. XHP0104 TaxID=2984335 RepID=UPI0021E91B2C|nr:CTP synthetase [Actibacterium sp. XHP0104]MCV2882919.1 CTP synthetase [Actibacterium sp. XHP0104]
MLQLARILYALISTTLAGTAVIIALVTGYDTLVPIVIAAAVGFVLAIPATWVIARALLQR